MSRYSESRAEGQNEAPGTHNAFRNVGNRRAVTEVFLWE